MAACVECGKKAGLFSKTCMECDIRMEEEGEAQFEEDIKDLHPSLFKLIKTFDLNILNFNWEVLQAIPKSTKFEAVLERGTFLTERGILIANISLTGTFKSIETIPLRSISTFEAKPPSNDGDAWRVTIVSNNDSNLVITFFPDEAVQDFIEKVQIATSKSGGNPEQKAASSPTSTSTSTSEKFKELQSLFEEGLITQEQLDEKKRKLLDEM